MKESDLTTKIIKGLETIYGGWWMKVHGSPSQVSGIPDIIGVCRGNFHAFEVKLPGKEGTLSPRQRYIIAKMVQNGATVKVVTSVEDALAIMEGKYG